MTSEATGWIETAKARARVWLRDPRNPAEGYVAVEELLVAIDALERALIDGATAGDHE